jgi:lactate racemase
MREVHMSELFVRYHDRKTPVSLPTTWHLLTVADFKEHHQRPEPGPAVKAALSEPIGCRPLAERMRGLDRVAVIIEDQTRASPKKIVLSALLNELERIGVADERIDIVIGLGTHQFLTPAEIADVYGADVAARYRISNHDCRATDLVTVSRLRSGTPVRINRIVYEADFRIGIGSIFAHPLNGFGGGGKILFPATADAVSILEHHLRYSFRNSNDLGRIAGNPFYEEVSAHARAGRLDFIINSVLDHNDQFFDVVCGDPVKAHLEGVDRLKAIISKPFSGAAEVTITSAFPYTAGPQIMKPLAPASMVTRRGGCIILFADIRSPLPEVLVAACESFRTAHAGRLRAAVLEHFDRQAPIVPQGAPELNMSLAQLLLAQDDYTLILVSSDMPAQTAERLGLHLAADFEEAAGIVSTIHTAPGVHIIPAGGVILPVLPKR